MSYQWRFAWSSVKARANFRKHGVSFQRAATVLRDPLAVSVYDPDCGREEERWITMGEADDGSLLVVVHTFKEIADDAAAIRLISARKATRNERQVYERR